MSRKNIIYFSRIKALACIAVVLLHTFYAAAAFAKTKDQLTVMMTVRNLMSWAVPCFVMVTGALLLDKQRELGYKKLFTKLILRMVIALVVFSLLFSVFDAVLIAKDFSFETIGKGFETALFGGGWKHMWYLYLMISLYLLMPAYKLVSGAAKKNDMRYILIVYSVFLCVLPTIDAFTGKSTAFYICVYTVYPLYLFAGHAMHQQIVKINLALSALLFVAGGAAITALTIYTTGRQTELASLLNNYSFTAIAAMSVGLFGLMQSTKDKSLGFIDKIAQELEKCSFGIYLLHMAALKIVFVVIGFDPIANGGAITVFAVSLGVLAVSYAVTRLLRFIPVVNKII